MGQFLVVLRGANFPWAWMILTFLANMSTNYLLLQLPDIWYIVSALTKISTYNIILAMTLVAFVPIKYIYLLVIGRKYYQTRLGIFQQIGGLTMPLTRSSRQASTWASRS